MNTHTHTGVLSATLAAWIDPAVPLSYGVWGSACAVFDPSKRVTVEQALEHPYLVRPPIGAAASEYSVVRPPIGAAASEYSAMRPPIGAAASDYS
eukprot:6885941-Pyramimonas_sp.AAC.2